MLLPVLASAFVGGIIGYITNWLAIKMLFRPLTEKYIGKWRLPFTPGLIPKKRAALAQSLGNTVADYLVTTDTLAAAVKHPQFRENLEDCLSVAWTRLNSEQRSLAELLQALGEEDWLAGLPERLAEQILLFTHNSEWLSQVRLEMRSTIAAGQDAEFPLQELADCGVAAIAAVLTNENVRDNFLAQLMQCFDQLRTEDTKSLADVLPLAMQQQVHNLILSASPSWLDWLHKKLQEADNKAIIQAFIQEFMTGSTALKLLSAFTDTAKLADAIIHALAKEEMRAQIVTMLLDGWGQLLAQPVADIAAKIDAAQLSQKLQRAASNLLQPDLLTTLQGIFYQSLKLEDGQVAGDPELTLHLESIAQQALELVVQAPATKRWLTALLKSMLTRLLQLTPAELVTKRQLLSPRELALSLQAWLLKIVTSRGAELLAALRLTEVVEAQVNALDMVQVEDILLQIIKEQLSAITNLGFVLGALLGTIMPFINNLLGTR